MKCFKCCCITFIIVLALVLVGGYIGLSVLTPEKLGIADQPILNGKSFTELGLQDKSLLDIIKAFTSLTKEVDRSDAVTNGYDESDLSSAESKLGVSGDISAASVVFDGADGGITEDVILSDKEFAALSNQYVEDLIGKSDDSEFAKMAENGVVPKIEQISVIAGDDGKATVSTVVSLNVKEIVEKMSEELKNSGAGAVSGISLAENYYVSLSAPMKIEGDDVVSDGTPDISIVGMDKAFSDAILTMFGSDDGGINNVLGGVMATLMNTANVTSFTDGGLQLSPSV